MSRAVQWTAFGHIHASLKDTGARNAFCILQTIRVVNISSTGDEAIGVSISADADITREALTAGIIQVAAAASI